MKGATVPLPEHAPTEEQQTAIEMFRTGKSFAIEALAGTGKTSTLVMLAYDREYGRGQYVAFNKAIVLEAKDKMPRDVACNTAHSLAYREIVGNPRTVLGKRLARSKRIQSWQIARDLGLRGATFGDKFLKDGTLASIVMAGISRFCMTADPVPTERHIPYQDGLDEPGGWTHNGALREMLLPYMLKAWGDIVRPDGKLAFKHDHYLKMWQLSNPRINADYILFDEAQDADPVMVDVIAKQDHAQIVWVGDSNQQIYAWRGAVNALGNVPVEHRTYLTQSFRFGTAIAEAANKVLGLLDCPASVRGLETISSTVGEMDGDADVVLTRTNARAVQWYLEVLEQGKKPHIVGGAKDVIYFAEAALELASGGRTRHPELACFTSWEEVQRYVVEDAQGADLALLVRLVDTFGAQTIVDKLKNMPSERDADIVISTAHKSKGLEWDRVIIANDFPEPKEGKELGAEELRLAYVAITRAKLALDCTSLYMFREAGQAIAG